MMRLIRSPWALLVAIVAGVALALGAPWLAKPAAGLSRIFILAIEMCIVPILFATVTTSVGRLVTAANVLPLVRRTIAAFGIATIGIAVLATAIAVIAGPGRDLQPETLRALGVIVDRAQIDLEIPLDGAITESDEASPLMQFALTVVPQNIFDALAKGASLQIIFASILLGGALGYLKAPQTKAVFDVLDGINEGFRHVIEVVLLFLPVEVMVTIVAESRHVSPLAFSAMGKFSAVIVVTYAIVLALGTAALWARSGESLGSVLQALRQPALLALSTRDIFSTLPSSIFALERLRFDRETSDLVTPLGILAFRFGTTAYLAIAAAFVVQLYRGTVTPGEALLIASGAIFAALSTAGFAGTATVGYLSLVLAGLKLPLGAVLVLFLAIDPFIEPLRTLVSTHAGIVTAAFIGTPSSRRVRTAADAPELPLAVAEPTA